MLKKDASVKLDYLPIDILLNIFLQLSGKDLLNIARVNKKFFKISENGALPHRFFSSLNSLSITYLNNEHPIEDPCKKLFSAENLIFGFTNKYIYIWEKNPDINNLKNVGKIVFNKDAFWHVGYQVDGISDLWKLYIPFRKESADRLDYICSNENAFGPRNYYKGTLCNFYRKNRWESSLDILNLTKKMTVVTINANFKLFIGYQNGDIEVQDIQLKAKRLKLLKGHSQAIRALAVENERLCSISNDETLRIWNLKNYQCEIEFNFPCQNYDNVFLKENKLLTFYKANKEKNGCIAIWDLSAKKQIVKLDAPPHWETCTLVDDCLLIATNCKTPLLRLIKLDCLKSVKKLREITDSKLSFNKV